MEERAWRGFNPGLWQERIDTRDFIQKNYTPYEGDASFLATATARTNALKDKLNALADAVYDKAK